MNFRYLYIVMVVLFAYLLFYSWTQESKQKQELVEASYVENIAAQPGLSEQGFLEIKNDNLVVRVGERSGRVVEARLINYKFLQKEGSLGVRVFGEDPQGVKFYLGSGFTGESPEYKVQRASDSEVVLISLDGRFKKSISLDGDDYELIVVDQIISGLVENETSPYIAMYRTDGKALDARSGWIEGSSYTGVAFNTPKDPYDNYRLSSIDERMEFQQRGGWLGFIQKYFMAAILPDPDQGVVLSVSPPQGGSDVYVMASISSDVEAIEMIDGFQHRVFIGPKIRSDLMSRASNLELSIDMGWFWFLAQPLVMLLSLLHGVVGNWGVAIILLTLLIKLLFWPLSSKGFQSMAKMRSVQPLTKEIQERYKDDRAKLGTEMMALYKKEGINPVGGCFPMLLQMPVFVAFFFCLRESVELRHAPFFLWIQDLSAPDPLFILPVIFAGLMYLTQTLNPQPPGMDPMQAQVMKFMPIMIAGIFVIMPAGLVLYSVVNSGVSLIQQRALYKKYGGSTSLSGE